MLRAVLLSLMLLAGCDNYFDADGYEISECQRLGYRAGTESFSNCRLQVRAIEAQRETTGAIEDLGSSRSNDSISRAGMKCRTTNGGWVTRCSSSSGLLVR